MDQLDRYLQSVKKFLPRHQQDDLVAELRANLESQLDDKQNDLGRRLTPEEMKSWLDDIGSPMLVAGRYQPQRYLIGPAIFPMYWIVLKMAVVWSTAIYGIVSVVQSFAADRLNATGLVEAALRLPGVLLTTATCVTVIFVAFEFAIRTFPEQFRAIPISGLGGYAAQLAAVELVEAFARKPRSYATAIAEVVFGFLLLVLILLIPQHPYLLWGPGVQVFRHAQLQLAPIWMSVFWSLVAMNVLQLAWRSLNLINGRWQQPQHLQKIVVRAVGLIPLGLLLQAKDLVYFSVKQPALEPMQINPSQLATANHLCYDVALLIAVISGLQLLWEIGQLCLSAYRKRTVAVG